MTLGAVTFCYAMWETKFPRIVWVCVGIDIFIMLPRAVHDAAAFYSWFAA